MSKKTGLLAKASLLSASLVSTGTSAVLGILPAISEAFPDVPVTAVEAIGMTPSLFSTASILLSPVLFRKTGYRKAAVFGFLLCGIFGLLPIFVPLFPVLFACRCIYGIGAGLLSSSLMALIVSCFEGEEKSAMIGYQGSIGAIGSSLLTFLAGRLALYGWNKAFFVYLTAFLLLPLFVLFSPKEKAGETIRTKEKASSGGRRMADLLYIAVLQLFAVTIASVYLIKTSSLVVNDGLGRVSDGALAITIAYAGCILAGPFYAKTRAKLKAGTLVLGYVLCALSFVITAKASSLPVLYFGSLILGYGYMTFIPYTTETVSASFKDLGSIASNTMLLVQAIGGFLCPYFASFLTLFTKDVHTQYLIIAGLLLLVNIPALANRYLNEKN